tara:strand:- start:775 stop:909 length:135 start_codon:yes stop_codon:yes gene_type:complete
MAETEVSVSEDTKEVIEVKAEPVVERKIPGKESAKAMRGTLDRR